MPMTSTGVLPLWLGIACILVSFSDIDIVCCILDDVLYYGFTYNILIDIFSGVTWMNSDCFRLRNLT